MKRVEMKYKDNVNISSSSILSCAQNSNNLINIIDEKIHK